MSESRSRREKRLQEMAGDLGKASVRFSKSGTAIYQISCRTFHEGGKGQQMAGCTYRSGHPNTFRDALERWTNHLAHSHPDAPTPPGSMYLYELQGERASIQ